MSTESTSNYLVFPQLPPRPFRFQSASAWIWLALSSCSALFGFIDARRIENDWRARSEGAIDLHVTSQWAESLGRSMDVLLDRLTPFLPNSAKPEPKAMHVIPIHDP